MIQQGFVWNIGFILMYSRTHGACKRMLPLGLSLLKYRRTVLPFLSSTNLTSIGQISIIICCTWVTRLDRQIELLDKRLNHRFYDLLDSELRRFYAPQADMYLPDSELARSMSMHERKDTSALFMAHESDRLRST